MWVAKGDAIASVTFWDHAHIFIVKLQPQFSHHYVRKLFLVYLIEVAVSEQNPL
jgi:hypothetical protein